MSLPHTRLTPSTVTHLPARETPRTTDGSSALALPVSTWAPSCTAAPPS